MEVSITIDDVTTQLGLTGELWAPPGALVTIDTKPGLAVRYFLSQHDCARRTTVNNTYMVAVVGHCTLCCLLSTCFRVEPLDKGDFRRGWDSLTPELQLTILTQILVTDARLDAIQFNHHFETLLLPLLLSGSRIGDASVGEDLATLAKTAFYGGNTFALTRTSGSPPSRRLPNHATRKYIRRLEVSASVLPNTIDQLSRITAGGGWEQTSITITLYHSPYFACKLDSSPKNSVASRDADVYMGQLFKGSHTSFDPITIRCKEGALRFGAEEDQTKDDRNRQGIVESVLCKKILFVTE